MPTFSIKAAFRFGWEKTKKHFWFLAAVMVGTWLVSMILNWAGQDRDASFPLVLIVGLLSWAVGIALEIGITRISLKMQDDVRGGIEDFLPDWDLFWRVLGTSIIYGLIVIAGLILLIVPGVIWALKYYFATWLAIDKGLRPMEAIRESGKMTSGNKGQLFLFWLACIGIILLGVIALFVGLLWAVPTAMIATAFVYRKLSERGQKELPLEEAKA